MRRERPMAAPSPSPSRAPARKPAATRARLIPVLTSSSPEATNSASVCATSRGAGKICGGAQCCRAASAHSPSASSGRYQGSASALPRQRFLPALAARGLGAASSSNLYATAWVMLCCLSETNLCLRQELVLDLGALIVDEVHVELKLRRLGHEQVQSTRPDGDNVLRDLLVAVVAIEAEERLIRLGPPVVVLALVAKAAHELLAEAQEHGGRVRLAVDLAAGRLLE